MTTTLKNIRRVCRTCGGEGEVRTMEYVYPGEPHQADIGSAPCPDCSPRKREEDREQEDYP